MKIFVVVLLFVFSTAHAQSIQSLLESNALRTSLSLPFRAKTASNQGAQISNIEFIYSGGMTTGSCQYLLDPYILGNFFIKCSKDGQVTLRVTIAGISSGTIINYGPLAIQKLSTSGVEGIVDNGPDFTVGEQLYINYCSSCHGARPPSSLYNKDVNTIKQKIANQPEMKTDSGLRTLTDAQIRAIADYLSSF